MTNSKHAVHALVTKFVDALQEIFLADLIQAVADRSTRLAPKSATARAKGAKRDPVEIKALTTRFQKYVLNHPGQRIEQIAAGMGCTTKELNLPVKKLQASKQLRTVGQKRSTSYSIR